MSKMNKENKISDITDCAGQEQKACEIISEMTGHENVRLVNRGNAAIFCALRIVKKANPKPFILVPDQGGWFTFRKYPKLLGFDTKTVKTNRGLIDLVDLEKKAEGGAALLVTSHAGYFAEQPMKYISNICKRNKCIVIEDASGALGDGKLACASNADIIVASFGKWKAVDAGYGGMISTNNKTWFDESSDVFSITNYYPDHKNLIEKLEAAPSRIAALNLLAEKTKKEIEEIISGVKILHRDLQGLNVVVRYFNNDQKQLLIDYCDSKSYEYVQCPKYIRVDEDAISIELKRIDTSNIKKKR